MMNKCIIIGGAVSGMAIGAMSSYLTVVMLKNKTTVCGMMKCKAKDAFKTMTEKFSL